MSVYLKPVSVIKARLGVQNNGPVHAFFTETCDKHMGKFVPGGEGGELNTNKFLDTSEIVYKSPYAHYQYIGKIYVDPKYKVAAFPIRGGKISFKESDGPIEGFVSRKGIEKIPTNRDLKYHTPGTGSHWDKRMWTSHKKEVIKTVQNFIDRGCKQ